jgi:uncharacterized protein
LEAYTIIILCFAAFLAGFVDAVVGGGGLIQTPISLILLPNMVVSSIMGSLKIPGISGTSFAASQYLKKVTINWKLFFIMAPVACIAAFTGSMMMTIVSNAFMKPLLLIVLILLAVYTFIKKDFGQAKKIEISKEKLVLYGVLISFVIGFYDGFIGPGAGSFFVLAFIVVLGYDFLNASASAKLVNIATNLGSITFFILKGKIIWTIAIPMAFCNAFGGWLGAKTALKKGNKFIRIFFLVVVVCTIIRFGYDVFFN